ncbi:MAG: hypothetical protein Q8K79_19370 [Solirubrobacteraceae bacterium]|nr:hypothetical protein [Solirubrobacteraceae bacterium]
MSGSTTTKRSGGVDFPTLIVTALASATAAYVTSKLWTPGTLAAAAFTPVLVAVLKEAYFKPVDVVTRAVPVRGVVRSAPSVGAPDDEPRESPEDIEARIAQLGEAPGASLPARRRNWQIAVVTGLLGFIIAAVIITVPELVAGSSASGGDRGTTIFGGKTRSSSSTPTDTTTTTTPSEGESEGVPPASTVTVPPAADPVTVPPPSPTPVPEEGETPPPPEEETPEVPATPPSPPAPPG